MKDNLGLVIDPHFEGLVPGLYDEVILKSLRDSVVADGRFTYPLIAWKDPHDRKVLVDGHRRYYVWMRVLPEDTHVRPPRVEVRDDWQSRDEVKQWIIQNALAVRGTGLSKLHRDKLVAELVRIVRRRHRGESEDKTIEAKMEDVGREVGLHRRTVSRIEREQKVLDKIQQIDEGLAEKVQKKATRKDLMQLSSLPTQQLHNKARELVGEKPRVQLVKDRNVDVGQYQELDGKLTRFVTDAARRWGVKDGRGHVAWMMAREEALTQWLELVKEHNR